VGRIKKGMLLIQKEKEEKRGCPAGWGWTRNWLMNKRGIIVQRKNFKDCKKGIPKKKNRREERQRKYVIYPPLKRSGERDLSNQRKKSSVSNK